MWPRRRPGPAGSNCRPAAPSAAKAYAPTPAGRPRPPAPTWPPPDVTGTVQLRGSTAVIVHTAATYHTKFLGIIGIDQVPVTGSAESRIVRAVEGVER